MGRERKALTDLNGNDLFSRNKDKLKEHVLYIFDKRIQENGIKGTSFRQVVEDSGKARSIVYKYYGTKERLIMDLLKSDKYRMLFDINLDKILADHQENHGEELYKMFLGYHFNQMRSSRFVQELNLMKLTESSALMDDIISIKEDFREKLLVLGKDYFKHKNIDFIAVIAILLAGLNFIIQYSKNNKGTYYGFDTDNKQNMDLLVKTAQQLIQMVYDYAKEK